MSEIQRWTPELVRYFNKVGPGLAKHEIGSYVLWTDHVAALKAARNELPDVGSWSPEPKFNVGDIVVDPFSGSIFWEITEAEYVEGAAQWYYSNDNWRINENDLTLYVPPATTCGCPGGYPKVAEVPTPAAEVKAAAIKAAVLAERVRCLEIVEKIHGFVVGIDGYLRLDPYGELVRRSRVETAIRWVKVK